jgi:hypothetical protein
MEALTLLYRTKIWVRDEQNIPLFKSHFVLILFFEGVSLISHVKSGIWDIGYLRVLCRTQYHVHGLKGEEMRVLRENNIIRNLINVAVCSVLSVLINWFWWNMSGLMYRILERDNVTWKTCSSDRIILELVLKKRWARMRITVLGLKDCTQWLAVVNAMTKLLG